MPFYSKENLLELGFASIGKNVFISNKASIYGADKIHIGNNVRIDDFCILSAGKEGIYIGNNVHIACFTSLIGKEKITIEDFSGISSRVSIYSSTDDFSGNYLTGPTVNSDYTNVISNPVYLHKHVIIGSGSIILPGVTLNIGVAVGALSLVNKSFPEFTIVGGTPAKILKVREKKLIQLEQKYINL